MSDIRVLFVCVHDSARSQMAEALLRRLGGERFLVESAGFEPRPITDLAVEALRQIGIEAGAAKSQAVFDLFRAGRRFDYVISVCDEANGERCPIFPGITQRLHWAFPDPASFEGSAEARLASTITLRDAIAERIATWLQELESPHAQT